MCNLFDPFPFCPVMSKSVDVTASNFHSINLLLTYFLSPTLFIRFLSYINHGVVWINLSLRHAGTNCTSFFMYLAYKSQHHVYGKDQLSKLFIQCVAGDHWNTWFISGIEGLDSSGLSSFGAVSFYSSS